MAKLRNAQDVLPKGETRIYEVTGPHGEGEGEYGKWYRYEMNYNGEKLNVWGDDRNKYLLDTGFVSLNCYFSKGKNRLEVLEADDILAQPQNQNIQKPKKEQHKEIERLPEEQPDWDAIALGKCRSLIAVEAYKLGEPLTQDTVEIINRWAEFMMTGKLN